MTGYRRGDKVNCGRDATGYKLFARSATQCAYKGHGWRQILRTFYGPGLELVGDGTSEADSQTPDLTDINSADVNSADTTAGVLPQQRVDDRTYESPNSLADNGGFFGSTTGGLADALKALDVVDGLGDLVVL